MVALTDGLITEEDRLAAIAGTLESVNPVTTRCMAALALKLGVSPETLIEAADGQDQGALMETEASAVIREYLSECG